MSIGVVFEIIVSALAVVGMYALVCEFIRGILCRGRYHIAVSAEAKSKREILEDIYMARRLIDISTGATKKVILLVDDACRADGISDVNADLYIKFKGKTED